MTNIRIDKIQIKRGTVANLPTLDDGELFYAYDTKEHYLGMGGENQLISKDFSSLNQHYESVLSRFGINSSGKLMIDNVEFAGGGSAGSLVFNTLADLQAAYPYGTTQPAWIVADNAWYYWSGAVTPPADTTAPVITASSSGGTFTSAQSVTLSANETSTIYYTLDGSTPTTSSTVYSSAISIGSTSTLKFFGKDAAGNSSAVQSISFTINAPDTTAPTVNISPAAGTYASAQSVTLTANEPSTIYYTSDGSTPTTSSTVYSTPISISANTTLKYFAKDTAGNSSAVQTAAYTIDTVAPVVTASPAAGTYTSAQSVTLSSEAGATIYYTTNGATPSTSSTVYSGPITISATTTLQFIGKDAVGNLSVPVAATYTINIPDTTAPVLTITPAATFATSQTVTMSANETATIWYTVDGSDPTVSGTKVQYSAPVTLTATTTVKAYAVDSSNNASAVQTVTYTKQAAGSFTTILDSFNRADNLALGTTDTGETWVQHTDVKYGVIGNQAYQSQQVAGGVPRLRKPVTLTVPSNQYAVELTFAALDTGSTTGETIHLRYQDASNMVYAYRATGKMAIYKMVAGTLTKLGDGVKTLVSGDRIRLENKSDGTIKLYENGSLVATVTDTAALNATNKVGFACETNASRFEDFRVEALV